MGNLTVHLECTSGFDARGRKLLASEGVQSAFLLNANPEQIQYALDHTTGIVVVRVYDPFGERNAWNKKAPQHEGHSLYSNFANSPCSSIAFAL
jgi:hypothetical protein